MRIRRVGLGPGRCSRRSHESGVALIIALLALLILSTLAAGLMYTTQSEIWTTSNYRQITQARYAAQAGEQQAIYFFNHTWTVPSTFSSSGVKLGDFPVSLSSSGGCANSASNTPSFNQCIVMAPSTMTGYTDTYSAAFSDSAMDAKFAALSNSSSSSPFSWVNSKPSYAVAAQLLSATLDTAGSGNWLTSWKIISQGSVGNSKVQVVATISNVWLSKNGTNGTPTPSFNYGLFATGTGCSSIEISGGSNSNSYNSASSPSGSTATYTGNLATMGNVSLHNSGMVYGSISAPNYNKGDSSAGYGYCATYCPWNSNYFPYGTYGGSAYYNVAGTTSGQGTMLTCPQQPSQYAVNLDNSGGTGFNCSSAYNASSCSNKASALPATYTGTATYTNCSGPTTASCTTYNANGSGYGDAVMASWAYGTTNTSTCTALVGCNDQYSASTVTFQPNQSTSYGKVTLGSSDTYSFAAGSYYFDTLTITESAKIVITSGPVQIYILNHSNSTTPLNFTGGTQTNLNGDPGNLEFIYNGTQEVHIGSISSNAVYGTIYSPNAKAVFDGNGNVYGAVVASSVSLIGSGNINYDTHLGSESSHITTPGGSVQNTPSSFNVTQFSWSAF